ncbi:MAG: winged helix family transcriptional regulator [Micromonosporaceae bacterium]|nr:winged helix family transcriptional regulator [Micromonosporaceae bacterium]
MGIDHTPAMNNGGRGDAAEMPVVIGVAPTLADRVRLAELLDGFGPVGLVLVSTLDEARRMLDGAVPGTGTGTSSGQPAGAGLVAAGEPTGNGRVKQLAGVLVDSDLLLVSRNGHHVRLTPLEHDLLVCLGSEPRQTWTHAALHEAVWNTRHVGGQADIHSVVKRLRRKLAGLGAEVTITAVRGVGFRLGECLGAGPTDPAEVGDQGAGSNTGTAADLLWQT